MLTTELISSIEIRASVPEAQETFTEANFLSMIDEEMQSKLLPLILSQMEEYYVADYPYTITSGQSAYPMPSRAAASMLRDVQVISSSDPESIMGLEKLQIENLFTSGSSSSAIFKKSGFYVKMNTIYMYPTPTNTSGILNLEYYSRPNASVSPTDCGLITAIDTTLKQVTVSAAPTTITTSTLVDFVKAKSGFECTAIDQTITSIAGTVYTFSAALPTTLAVGDYVCEATKSCVIQAPQELMPLLSQYVTVRVLSSQGDEQAYDRAIKELAVLEKNAVLLISPRVSGKVKRVTNTRGVSRFV